MRKSADILRAFTLVELIVVMALLALTMAFAAPSLARSMRGRHLDHEATRFIALTEYGRDEAVSQGVPMALWIDAASGRFGIAPKAGYASDDARGREYVLTDGISFDTSGDSLKQTTSASLIEFAPDGSPEPANVESIRLVDRFSEVVLIARTSDGWGYEIFKETR